MESELYKNKEEISKSKEIYNESKTHFRELGPWLESTQAKD